MSRTIGREQEMRSVRPATPTNAVDLLFDFQTLEVIEFRFMRLELGVELVLASLL